MKIKPEIKERILAAANALSAEGIENPTNDQVREQLGGGSLSHISPVMREWRDSHKEKLSASLEIPSELKKSIEISVSQMWTVATKIASSTIEAVRRETDAAIQAAIGERDEALIEISRLEERIAELQKSLEKKDQTIKHAQGELERERINNAKLASDNAVLRDRVVSDNEELVARINDKVEQIENLKIEIRDARNNNKVLQENLVEIARNSAVKQRP